LDLGLADVIEAVRNLKPDATFAAVGAAVKQALLSTPR